MQKKDIIVIGASAGSIEPLRMLAGGLPKDFHASIFVVLHTSPQGPGILAEILDRAGPLPAVYAIDKEHIQRGRIYVAPPDYHMLVESESVRLSRGPKENMFRPAVDPLFRSAAQVYGPRVIGVILSGGLDDGTSGLWAIKQLGGTTVVQDPKEASNPSMPENAMRYVKVDHCIPASEIAPLLVRLAETPAGEGVYKVSEEMEIEIRVAKEDNSVESGIEQLGQPSSYTCPECHGALLQLAEGDRVRFRCHTGHAYSADSLLAALTEWIEDSLWNSIRSIEESVRLLNHMADHLHVMNNERESEQLLKKAQEAQRQADLVRQAVFINGKAKTDEGAA